MYSYYRHRYHRNPLDLCTECKRPILPTKNQRPYPGSKSVCWNCKLSTGVIKLYCDICQRRLFTRQMWSMFPPRIRQKTEWGRDLENNRVCWACEVEAGTIKRGLYVSAGGYKGRTKAQKAKLGKTSSRYSRHFRRNPDDELRALEHEYTISQDPEILRRIVQIKRRAGLPNYTGLPCDQCSSIQGVLSEYPADSGQFLCQNCLPAGTRPRVKKKISKKRRGRSSNEFRRNPWSASDVKRHNKPCAKRKACRKKWPSIANAVLRDSDDEGKAIRIANWQVNRTGLRRRNPRRHYSRIRRHNPYSPYSYYHNPSEKDDMKIIKNTMKDLTPCDKKDWGLARHYYRNPEPESVSHGICPDCFI